MSNRIAAFVVRALFVPVIVALASCGGGGATPPVDSDPPNITIQSPVCCGFTLLSTITVSGIASDDVGVISVTVNGVSATTVNGYATWSAQIPLVVGTNTIRAEARDATGNMAAESFTYQRHANTTAPTAQILFPPADAMTTGSTVTVVGTASDGDQIAGVSVNGNFATTTDGFANWRVTVPLTAGSNTLTVRTIDVTSAEDLSAATVDVARTTVWAQRPTGVSYDATGDRMLVVDSAHDGVLAISATDAISVLSSPALGTGAVLGSPNEITSIGSNAFVGSNLDSTIAKVDLTTGNRTALSGGGAGSGTAFVALFGIGADASRNRVLALDFHQQGFPQSNRLFTVDPSTGARALLSGGGAGSGATFGLVSAIVHDTVNDRYVTVGNNQSTGVYQVLAIDPVTGARTELSGSTVGSGVSLSGGRDLVLLSPSVALVLTAPNSANARNLNGLFVSVDLTTGVRTAVTFSGVVTQPTFASGTMSMDIDPDTGDVYLTESAGAGVYRIALNSVTDIASVALVEPAEASIGSGPKFVFSAGLAFDPAGQRFFVTERRPDQITAIALNTAARSVASSATVGTGTAPSVPRRVEWDATNTRALMVDGFVSVSGVAPTTGDRTLIGNDPTVLGNSATIVASTMDAGRNRILLGGFGDSAVNAMNLTTGVVSTVTTLSTTSATSAQVKGLGYDAASDRYLAADEDGKIFRIVAGTGATSLLADGVPAGLNQPGGIAVASATVAYVHDQLDGELYQLNPSTGVLTRVFGPSSPGTHGSGNDGALAWDAARGLLYWTDNGIHGISVFEPVSGDRVIISR